MPQRLALPIPSKWGDVVSLLPGEAQSPEVRLLNKAAKAPAIQTPIVPPLAARLTELQLVTFSSPVKQEWRDGSNALQKTLLEKLMVAARWRSPSLGCASQGWSIVTGEAGRSLHGTGEPPVGGAQRTGHPCRRETWKACCPQRPPGR